MQEKRKDNKGRVLRKGETQRADGKYMFRYTDLSGNRQTVYSWKLVDTDKTPEGRNSQKSLRELEKQIQRDMDDRIRTKEANKMTVDDSFRLLMELRTDLRETTRCNYICLYDTHIRKALGNMKIGAVTATDIKKFYMALFQETHLKSSSVRSIHAIVYQMFENAVADNIIRSNPALNALKVPQKMLGKEQEKRHALTEEEQANLIDFVYSNKAYKRWGTLFTLLLGTGLRIGEALGLRWCDCDFKKNIIKVDHALLYKTREEDGCYEYRISEPKTAAGKRIIPMFADVRKALLRERARKPNFGLEPFSIGEYTGFIFLNGHGKVFTPGAVFAVIQDISAAYNREEFFRAEKEGREPCYLPKFSAHILRHTFCTRLCENESNLKIIQDIMGHRKISTTMEVYNEATNAKKQASFQSIEGKIKLA